jgi:DNA-binding NarL/FixJ family response regulator
MRLLEVWADSQGLKVSATAPSMPFEKGRIDENCAMVIFSVGSTSVGDSQQQMWMRSIRALIPNAPLVILSDRDETQEICAAFELGAAGFMPTSIEPMVALQALSFIRNGGSFFPPSALSHEATVPVSSIIGTSAFGAPQNRPLSTLAAANVARGKFTAKQEQVFTLLRQGHTNKLIARELGMSEATVKVHVRRIMQKFGATNRTQAVISAMGSNQNSEFQPERARRQSPT